MAKEDEAGAPNIFGNLRDLTTDALRFWELRRLFYNALLAVIVGAHFVSSWPTSRASGTFDGVVGFFLLGVLANVADFAVYVADGFIQSYRVRGFQVRVRVGLLGVSG